MDIDNKEFLLFLDCSDKTGLRYMCIGGYAVNYYGYHRATQDMDIWIAPTEVNKSIFLDTLKCMGYSNSEIEPIQNEDFTTYFMCSLGSPPNLIDILTIVHSQINFDEAEKGMNKHQLSDKIVLNLVPYDFLKDIKLRSSRGKYLFDVARLEELRKLK